LLYTPLIGVCIVLGALWPRLGRYRASPRVLTLVLLTSALQARAHALHYESDVLFWRATSHGTPGSAKAHLNLGVMLGARGDPEGRVRATRRSVELSPKWPLAHVYLADAMCRAGRPSEAIPHYVRGLELAPDQKDIAALSLQCLWDTGTFEKARPALERVATRDPRGWLGFLLGQVVSHGQENGGVPSAYRSHGYNQR
jgi:tetratricopeptide (TPR) repeat protein